MITSLRSSVRCFEDINNLRKITGDICPDTSCDLIYHDGYFVLSYDERDTRRSKELNYDMELSYETPAN